LIKNLGAYNSDGAIPIVVRVFIRVIFLSLWFLLPGCTIGLSSQVPQEQQPTSSPFPIVSTTSTIVWFPSTNTPTPIPTIETTPTPELLASLGAPLYQDDFSTGTGWDLFKFSWGSAALGNNQLTLVVLDPRAYVASVYNNLIIENFYLQITADVRLCTGLDEYGLIVRRASPADFYRFSLSCDGQMRMDRIYQGTASSPQPWMFSSSVPKVAPSIVQLGIWADGKKMRFFVDGVVQYEIEDPLLTSGNIGVFARSGGENAVTVNFGDLEIYQISR